MIKHHAVQLQDCLNALRDYDKLLDLAVDQIDTSAPDSEKILTIDLLLDAYRTRIRKLIDEYSETE